MISRRPGDGRQSARPAEELRLGRWPRGRQRQRRRSPRHVQLPCARRPDAGGLLGTRSAGEPHHDRLRLQQPPPGAGRRPRQPQYVRLGRQRQPHRRHRRAGPALDDRLQRPRPGDRLRQPAPRPLYADAGYDSEPARSILRWLPSPMHRCLHGPIGRRISATDDFGCL